MKVLKILSYQVGIKRSRSSDVRFIYLDTEDAFSGQPFGARFHFHELTTSADLGYEEPSLSTVVINLPVRDFEDLYHVLQTEKECYAMYSTQSQGVRVEEFQLGTFQEPLGEGFTDQG